MTIKAAAVSLLVLLAVWSAGCAGTAKPASDNGASEVATSEIPGESSAATLGDLELIRSLGASLQGETLYALVVASESTKAAAENDALEVLSSMGDAESYFVVEPASHMSGLPAGKYYVFEMYKKKPSQDTIDSVDFGPTPATVYKVTVKCSDPIPVVDDMEGTQ